MEGESFLPGGVLDLPRVRSRDRLALGTLSDAAALFLGCVISKGDHVLRMPDGTTCISLTPLRQRPTFALQSKLPRAGKLALVGALAHNPHFVANKVAQKEIMEALGGGGVRTLGELLHWPVSSTSC